MMDIISAIASLIFCFVAAASFLGYFKIFDPGFLGQGLTGIMGGYGNQYQFQQQPNPTPLQTALGTGATLAGIYGAVRSPGGVTSPFAGLNFGQRNS